MTKEEELLLYNTLTREEFNKVVIEECIQHSSISYMINHYSRINRGTVSESEIRSAVYLAICEAIHKYDPQKGFMFITYASFWIRKFILKDVGQYKHALHIPYDRALSGEYFSSSLDKPVFDDNDTTTRADLIEGTNNVKEWERREQMSYYVETYRECLEHIEWDIIGRYYGIEPHKESESMRDIAKSYKMTYNQCRNVFYRGIRNMRNCELHSSNKNDRTDLFNNSIIKE